MIDDDMRRAESGPPEPDGWLHIGGWRIPVYDFTATEVEVLIDGTEAPVREVSRSRGEHREREIAPDRN